MDQPLSQITRSMFKDMLETEIRLHQEAEARLVASRQFLLELANYLASEWLEQTQLRGTDLNQINPDLLMAVIRQRVTSLMARSSPAPANSVDNELRKAYYRLESQYREMEANKAQIEREKEKLEARIEQMTREIKAVKEAGAKATQLSVHYQNWKILPDFFTEWTQESFYERQAYLIRLMGETGLARAPELKEKLRSQFGLSKSSGSAIETIKNLAAKGFIADHGTEGGRNGRPPDIIELTPLGQAVYVFITGQKPVPSEYAIKKEHKTDAHTLLVLDAQDWLEKAGYQIVSQAPKLLTDDESLFNPDIVAKKGETTFYIEVERDGKKGNQDRDAKWKNFYNYTGGRMYFICENTKAKQELIREINVIISRANLDRAQTFFCNLSELNDTVLQTNGDIWTSARENGRNRV